MPAPRCRALLVPLALVAGCAPDPPPLTPAPAPSAPPPAYAPAAPAAPAVDPRSLVELPFSTTTTPVSAGMSRVVVSRQAIVLEGDAASFIPLPTPDRWAYGVDASYKRSGPNDLYVAPLAAAFGRAPHAERAPLAVGVDAAIPYRIFVEVLFTAGQSRYGQFHLLVRTAAGFGAIVVTPPSAEGRRFGSMAPPALRLAVFITAAGLSLKTSEGNVAPGCAGTGAGVALPRGPGGLDLAGLRGCATALRQRDARFVDEKEATLTANPDVPWGELVAVMDALRVDATGRVGFPDIAFGVAR